jgi:hypothetical protein
MKFVAALIVVVLAIGLIAWEANWRIDHMIPGPSSSSGDYVAQTRSLPEGSVLPYGYGVFVRSRYIPLWATSTLVFAGYCKPDPQLQWLSAKQLSVKCADDGSAKLFLAPDGVVVTHDRSGS